ncbi:MAG: phosphodiester glycosidase family protein, partial [bacterium]
MLKNSALSPFFTRIFILLLFVLPGHSAVADEINTKSIVPGVKYRTYRVASPAGSVTVHCILMDLDLIRDGKLILEPSLGGAQMGRKAAVKSIAQRVDAVAAINGPYFANSSGRTYPLGFAVLNGRIAQVGNLERPMVGLDKNGDFQITVSHPQAFVTSDSYFEPIWLWSVNAPAGRDSVTMYDALWGESVSPQGGTAVAIKPFSASSDHEFIVIDNSLKDEEEWDGEVVETSTSKSLSIPENGYALVFRGRAELDAARFAENNRTAVYAYNLPDGWDEMRWITTLGPWFLHNGNSRDYSDETQYNGGVNGRASRSAIGTTWNDEIFFAVTRGAGLTVREAARVLMECNVRDAVMCDSGSSSGMWAEGIGTIGNSAPVPLAFTVRQTDTPPESFRGLKVW